jgi:DNA-binding MarR family transcriptional regulator
MSRAAHTPDLTAHIGFWLRYVSNHVSQAFAQKLAGRDVTVAEWVVMRELFGAEAVAPSFLAARMGITRGAITKLADRLIAKALVIRAASTTDGRAQTLSLTAKARRLVPELAKLADQNETEFFSHLKRAEREELLRILKGVVARRALKTIPVT